MYISEHGLHLPAGMAECDACRRSFAESLLTSIGGGALQVCPQCAPEAAKIVRVEAAGPRLVRKGA